MASKMNRKGFTLFTALVSFLLIILAGLLVQSMIRSERNTTDIISDIQEQTEMEAVADLARADSLQVFNYGVRFSIEDWLTEETNFLLLDPEKEQWEEIKDDFARRNFGGTESGVQFANRTAKHLTSILSVAEDVGGYRVVLESNEQLLRQTLQEMFVKSVEKGEFFRVVQCEDGDYDDCLGTFYVNLDMEQLTDEAYESLPQIRVENTATGRVIKEPILPKGNFRIFIPTRIFKALAAAAVVGFDNSNGLFSAHVKQELERIQECERPDYDLTKARAKVKNDAKELVIGPAGNATVAGLAGDDEFVVVPTPFETVVVTTKDVFREMEGGQVSCAVVGRVSATLAIEEHNDKYKVSKNRESVYRIKLQEFYNR